VIVDVVVDQKLEVKREVEQLKELMDKQEEVVRRFLLGHLLEVPVMGH